MLSHWQVVVVPWSLMMMNDDTLIDELESSLQVSKGKNVNKEYVSKRVEREEEWKKSEICEFKGCEKCFVEHFTLV